MQSTKFLDGFSTKLAGQWSSSVLTPGFVFWAGGVLVGIQNYGWGKVIKNSLSDPVNSIQVITAAVLGLLLVSISTSLIQRFELATLRFLEGYWPIWLSGLRRLLVKQRVRRYHQNEEDWQNLKKLQDTQGLDIKAVEDLAGLEQFFRRQPDFPEKLMPTRLGNIFRAAELRPYIRYGLEVIVCWPHLWLLLPEQARDDLDGARQILNSQARVWLWSILFALVWTLFGLFRLSSLTDLPKFIWDPLALWPAALGFSSAILTYRWMLDAASNYSDLIEATFALYRFSLYEALHFELPTNSQVEKQKGQQITQYLLRGSVSKPIDFSNPP